MPQKIPEVVILPLVKAPQHEDSSAEEDTQLALLLMRSGDETAFRMLYDKHRNWVYSKTQRILRQHEDAMETAQDIFYKVWKKIDKWDYTQGSFQAWLNVIARNTIIDVLRKRNRIREHLLSIEDADEEGVPLVEYASSSLTPDRLLEMDEARNVLEEALAAITKPNHRIAWILRNLEGLSIAEISEALGCKAVGTVKTWIHRCTQELRQILIRKQYAMELLPQRADSSPSEVDSPAPVLLPRSRMLEKILFCRTDSCESHSYHDSCG